MYHSSAKRVSRVLINVIVVLSYTNTEKPKQERLKLMETRKEKPITVQRKPARADNHLGLN